MLTIWAVWIAGSAAGQELAVSTPGLASRSSDIAEGPVLKVTVYVYNHARASAPVLEAARREVGRVYRTAGVEMEWVDCPVDPEEVDRYPHCRFSPSRHDWVVVQIDSQAMIAGFWPKLSDFGLATLPKEGEFGNWAYVCFDCAEHAVSARPLLAERPYALGTILGDLMAHEIGHLVLATTHHSISGIMRPRWSPKDLEQAAFGRLMFFTADEGRRIRAQVRERMRAQETVNVASLRSPR